MMSFLFSAMLTAGFAAALLLGRMQALCEAMLAAGQEGTAQLLQLGGALCVWSGVLNVAKQAGVCGALARLFSPLMRRLYPALSQQSPGTAELITASFTANLMGLGAGATPPALAAMRQLDAMAESCADARRHMATLAVFNCCSVTLIPSTVAALRQQAGSADAMGILPAVWAASLASVAAAMVSLRLFEAAEKGEDR